VAYNLPVSTESSRGFVPYPFNFRRYPAIMPELREGGDCRVRPVAIVGAGPVGLCAALGLAAHGVPVVVLEADAAVCFGSRAICISRRSLEIIERLGALDAFMQIGLPWTGGRSFYRDVEVLRFSMPADENQKLPPMLNIAQYDIEQILVDRARAFGGLIDIRWQTKVVGIDAGASGARLHVVTPAGGYWIDADWVVAADGGRGFMREAMGLKMRGRRYQGRYVIVDIQLESDRPVERLAYFDPPCNRGSTVLVHKQPGNVWRIDYQLRDGEDPDAAVKPENVLPRVDSLLDMMGERGAWAPIWIGLYQANALTLDSYRAGRVLFAGDSAHLVPIFGVRGANSGIDDADNLAWKLAFVVKGLAAHSLLDSYSTERVAAARENLDFGARSTEFMAPPSFAFELMRKAVLSLAALHPEVRSLINPRQTAPITYSASPLHVAGSLAGAPAPGAVLLECPLTIVDTQGRRDGHITDLLLTAPAGAFTLLWFAATVEVPASIDALIDDLRARRIPVRLVPLVRAPAEVRARLSGFDHTGRLFRLYEISGETALLVRPDGHVLGRWAAPAVEQIAAAIERVLDR